MKDKRFVSTLRHLVGDKLDIHKVAFQVRAHLVSDENARRILSGGDFISSGKIINHTVMTEFHEHSRILQANFRNMTLRDKGRGDRRGTESVAEEKFSIVFQVSIYFKNLLVFGYTGCRFIVGSRKKAVASLLFFEFKKIVCRLKVISRRSRKVSMISKDTAEFVD